MNNCYLDDGWYVDWGGHVPTPEEEARVAAFIANLEDKIKRERKARLN